MDNSIINELVGKQAFDELDRLKADLHKTIGIVDDFNKKDLIGKQVFTQIDALVKDLQKSISVVEDFNSKITSAQGAMKAAKGFEEMAEAEKKAQTAIEGVSKAQQEYVQAEKKVAEAVKATTNVVEEGVRVLNQNASSRDSLVRIMTTQKIEIDAVKKQQRLLTKEYEQGKHTIDEYKNSLARLESARNHGQIALAKYRQELNIATKEEQANDSSFRKREQTLARLKNLYKDLEDANVVSPDIGGKLKAAIDELDASVKKTGGSIGEHQRNVGNYSITAKTLQGELLQLRNILAQLYNEGKGNTQQAQEVRKRIDELATSVNKVTKETKMLRSQTRVFDALLQGAQAAAATFGIYKSTLSLIGVEGEAAEKATQKLAAVIALITSLQQIQRLMVEKNALSWAILTTKQKIYNVVVGQSTGLTKAFRITLASIAGATVIGGIILLIANWDKLKAAISGTTKEQQLHNDVQEKANSSVADNIVLYRTLQLQWNQLEGSLQAQKKFLQNNKEEFGKLGVAVDDVATAERIFNEQSESFVQAMMLRAKATAAMEIATEQLKQAFEKQLKVEKAQEIRDKNSKRSWFAKTFSFDTAPFIDLAMKDLNEGKDEANQIAESFIATSVGLSAEAVKIFDSLGVSVKNTNKEVDLFDKANEKAFNDLSKYLDSYFSKQDKVFGKGAQLKNTRNIFEEQAKSIKKQIELNEQSMQLKEQIAVKAMEEELQREYERYKKGEINLEQYQKSKTDIERRGMQAAIDVQAEYLEYILKGSDLELGVRTALLKKLYDLKKQLRDKDIDGEKEAADNELEIQEQLKAKLKQLRQELFNFTATLFDAQFEKQKQAVDNEAKQVDKQTKKEVSLIEKEAKKEQEKIANSTLSNEEKNRKIAESEEEKNQRIEVAEAQAEAKHEALERRKAQIARQQAIFQKALTVAQVVADTAAAAIATLKTTPLPYGAGLLAATLAIGATQLATVLAAPIPAYEKGTDDHKGGLAIVGEKRKEMVITPDGRAYITSAKPQLVDLPKHTQVLPDAALAMQQLALNASRTSNYQPAATFDLSCLERGLASVEKAVVNSKAVQQVSFDRHGVITISENGKRVKKYVNQSVKY